MHNIVKEHRRYFLQIPMKVAELLPTWESNPPFKNFHICDAMLLLSIISTHQRKDDNGNIYAQLKMEFLRNRVWNADEYFRFFKAANIIKTIGGYVKNGHSYRYQFTDAYHSRYLKSELTNPKLVRKIFKTNGIEGRKGERKYPLQNKTIKQMTINIAGAESLVNELYGASENDYQISAYNYAMGSITRVVNKEFFHTVDPTGLRLHTNLTNMPKFLRGEIRIRDKHLSGVDIRNCEPYLANKFLFDPESTKPFFKGDFPLMKLKCLRLTEQQDVIEYRLMTSKARFYKYLEAEFNRRGCNYEVISETKVSNDLKRKIFQIFFDTDRHTSKEKRIFHELFPGVSKAFTVLREQNYVCFNYALTRMQSHIVLDVILDFINSEYPEMIAVQIHDNVTTSIATNDIERVTNVMIKELTEFVGTPPTLKIENFDNTIIRNKNSEFPIVEYTYKSIF